MGRVVQFDSKEAFGLFNSNGSELLDVLIISKQDLNGNFCSSFLISEFQSALGLFVMLSCFSSLALIMEVTSSVFALDGAIRVVLTLDGYGAVAFVDWVANVFSIFKAQASWLIVVEDRNSAFGITSNESVSILRIVELNEEIFIRFPSFVVNNLNLDNFRLLARGKVNNLVDSFEVFRGCSGIIASADSDFSSDSIFILNSHLSIIVRLRDGHMQATEAETVIFLTSLIRTRHGVFFSILAASLDNRLDRTDVVLFAVMESFHHRFTLKDVLEFL